MKSRVCRECGVRKKLDCFGRNKQYSDGLHRRCRECVNRCQKKHRRENYEYCLEYERSYRKGHLDACRQQQREYYLRNRGKILARHCEYGKRPEVRVRNRMRARVYYRKPEVQARLREYLNRPEVKARLREYRRAYQKEYYRTHPEQYAKLKKCIVARNRERFKTDPVFREKRREYGRERTRREVVALIHHAAGRVDEDLKQGKARVSKITIPKQS